MSVSSVGNPFIYRMHDILTLDYLGKLPFQGVTFGRSVDQPGAWQSTLNIADPGVQALGWREMTLEAASFVVPELYDTPLGGWEIWGTQYQQSGRGPVPFQGADVGASYFQERNQAYDYTSTWNTPNSGDPMSIMAQVLIDAINQAGTPLGLTAESVVLNPATGSPSGATVSVSYPGSSLQQVDSILQTLSQMGYGAGPDYSYDLAYAPGTKTPVITINIWSLRQGLTVAQSGLTIKKSQWLDFYYPVNGKAMGTNITEAGSGTGGVQPVTVTMDIPGWPRYDKSFVHTQVVTESALEWIAAGDASLYGWPVVNPWIEWPVTLPDDDGNLDPNAPPQLGTFNAGDDILVVIDPVTIGPTGEPRWGLNNDPRFPDGMSFEFRIQDWICTVADKGVSKIHVDLAIPPTGDLPPLQPPS